MNQTATAAPHAPAPRRRRWRLAAAAVVVALAVGAALTWAPTDNGTSLDLDSDTRAPTFSVPDLHDPERAIELADFEGRPVVLNFWATWCVPCRRELPAFQDAFERYGDQVAFLGMNHQDGRDGALELLAETGVQYPSGYDPQGKVAEAYGLFGMPTTVFITPDGRIAAMRTGEMSRGELGEALEELLAR